MGTLLINKVNSDLRVLSLSFAFILLVAQTAFNSRFVAAADDQDDQNEDYDIDMSDVDSVCGRRQWQQNTARIIDGSDAEFGDWPWMVALYKPSSSGDLTYYCGASLVNRHWVLTAAHCIYDTPASSIVLRLGDLDRSSDSEPLPSVEKRVKKVMMYQNYGIDDFTTDDIALLRLDGPITFKPNILPICLPKNQADYSGLSAYITGWGVESRRNGVAAEILQEGKLPIMDLDDCQYFYKSDTMPKVTENHICAGGNSWNPAQCFGDSGGPLVTHNKEKDVFEQTGIISFGEDCASTGIPGVSTRVDAYMDWITSIISQNEEE